MAVIRINTLPRLGPVTLVTGHFPPMQYSQQPVTLVPQGPKVSSAFGIDTKRNCFDQVWPIHRILLRQTVPGHCFAAVQGALVSCQKIVNMHRPGINVFEIRSFQREDAGVRTIQLRMRSDEISGVISRVQVLALTGSNIHFVVASCPVKEPFVVDVAVEIVERTREVAYCKLIVAGVLTRFDATSLRTDKP